MALVGAVNMETDWISNSSIGCVSGDSKLTREILTGLISEKPDDMKSKRININKFDRREKNDNQDDDDDGDDEIGVTKPETDSLIIRKINGRYSFENFDETQHLTGCPLKWFYNKKQSEMNSFHKIEKRKGGQYEVPKLAGRVNSRCVRGRTPVDVKIHKINLVNKDVGRTRTINNSNPTASEKKPKEEIRRANFDCKSKWKFQKVQQDDDCKLSETFSELSCRQNYLPPRPLVGMKPLLTILLFPNRESKCCTTKINFRSVIENENVESPTLSIKSLDLPLVAAANQRTESKTAIRCRRSGSKTAPCKQAKKHLVPNQVMINLQEKIGTRKKSFHSVSAKRSNSDGKAKAKNSFPTLVYQLGSKSNYRGREEGETFEDLIKDMTDDEIKFRRFFHCESPTNVSHMTTGVSGTTENTNENPTNRPIDIGEMHLTCGKIRIFQRKRK